MNINLSKRTEISESYKQSCFYDFKQIGVFIKKKKTRKCKIHISFLRDIFFHFPMTVILIISFVDKLIII